MLRELAELTQIDEGNPQSFRVRAYESAAQAIAAEASDLGRLTPEELQEIQGIGKSTAAKIRELLETGTVKKLEALRAKHPRSVVELLRIQGLGPKALGKLRAELGVDPLPETARAVQQLLDRLNAARLRLEQADDSEAAIEVLQELVDLGKEVQAEIERQKREGLSGG